MLVVLVPKLRLNANLNQEIDNLQYVENVLNDKHNHDWSQLTLAWKLRSVFIRDHLELGMISRRGRMPLGLAAEFQQPSVMVWVEAGGTC